MVLLTIARLGAVEKLGFEPKFTSVAFPYGTIPFATFEFRYRDKGRHVKPPDRFQLIGDREAAVVGTHNQRVVPSHSPRSPGQEWNRHFSRA